MEILKLKFNTEQLNCTCSILKTPCETLSSGKGSPIRQNPYKNKIQTLNVNGITHFGGTVKKSVSNKIIYNEFFQKKFDHTKRYITNAGVSYIKGN